jgi:hypothetical protein
MMIFKVIASDSYLKGLVLLFLNDSNLSLCSLKVKLLSFHKDHGQKGKIVIIPKKPTDLIKQIAA